MKYIHVLDEFSFAGGGGVRSVVADVSLEMARSCGEVYILALCIPDGTSIEDLKKWSCDHNITFDVLRSNSGSLLSAARKLRCSLKQFTKLDKCCLFLHLKRGVLVGILGSIGLKNVRRVEVFHSNYMNYKLQARICKHFLHHYLPVSKESRQQLIEDYGINPDKITLAYNGLDMNKIRSQVKPIDRDESVFRIISVGRMATQKNLETSIRAYCLFMQENENVRSEYLIAGDGPHREKLEVLAGGNVHFLGVIEREEVFSLIASANVVIFPSLWEGHSIALLEVLAVGCPVIVSDIPAFREVLDNQPLSSNELFMEGSFGAVFHKEDVDSCKAAIEYMVNHKEKHPRMREFVKSLADNYTLQKQATIYLEAAKF